MKTVSLIIIIPAILSFAGLPALSQERVMKGRSALEVNVGIWTGPTASTVVRTGGVRAEVLSGAFVGGVLFSHWLQEHLSLTLSAGILAGRISSTVSVGSASQHVSSVAPVLFGVKYFVMESDAAGQVRPYLSAAVGPYVGSEVSNTILTEEVRTQTAFGGRLGAGIDFLVSRHFKLGVNAGYHLMNDFASPVGGRGNYNGGEFLLGFGYVF